MSEPAVVIYPLVLTQDEMRALRIMIRVTHTHRLQAAAQALARSLKMRYEALAAHGELTGMPTEDMFTETFSETVVALNTTYVLLEFPLMLEMGKKKGSVATNVSIVNMTQSQLDRVKEVTSIKYSVSDDDKENVSMHEFLVKHQPGIQLAIETAEDIVNEEVQANHPMATGNN